MSNPAMGNVLTGNNKILQGSLNNFKYEFTGRVLSKKVFTYSGAGLGAPFSKVENNYP